MTTHLPECWTTDPSDPPAWCICDELRACEERMLAKCIEAIQVEFAKSREPADVHDAVDALRALQEKP